MRTESEFLVDLLARPNAAGVDYMLAGSMARNYWGIPRSTHDLGSVVQPKPQDVNRFVAVFRPGMFIRPESVPAAFQPPFQCNVLDEQSSLNADSWPLWEDAF